MQFSIVAIAAFAGLAFAHKNSTMSTSTVFTTVEHTVLQCASTVTNCPEHSKTAVVVTDTVALYTTICPVTATEVPATTAPVVQPSSAAAVTTVPVVAPTTAAPVASTPCPTEATGTPMAPNSPMTFATAPCPSSNGASMPTGTGSPSNPVVTSAMPIHTGAAVRAGPAMGGLAVAAAVAMML